MVRVRHCTRVLTDHTAYLEHDIDRAIIIDFDLHHGPFHLKARSRADECQATVRKHS
jgi:hypothetical protein